MSAVITTLKYYYKIKKLFLKNRKNNLARDKLWWNN